MLVQTKCKIYEFSRKFLEPKWSKRLNQYVTTGFEREIGWETRKVPKEIANAVYNHAFRINDNYPPQDGEIALIAREIDNYAVLAVATGLVDDSDRPLVAYRYFWLENLSRDNNIDGIGTLLQWWIEQGYPDFELKPSAEYQDYKNFHDASFLSKNELIDCYTDIVYLLKRIPENSYNSPIYLSVDNQSLNYPEKLHCLALLLNQEYNSPINWAFKVNKLEYPEQFTLIYTTIYPQAQLIINTPNFLNQLSEESTIFSDKISTESQLKRCLIEIARNKNLDSNFLKLANSLKEIDSYYWNWESILDKTLFNDNHDIATARYRALLAILKPLPEIFKWLYWLKKHRKKEFLKSGVELQNQFIEFLENRQLLETNKLVDHIYDIIDELLLPDSSIALSKKQRKSQNQCDYFFKERERLLVKSQSFWIEYFYNSAQYYARLLPCQLYCRRLNTSLNTDKFCQKVLLDWESWDKNQFLPPDKQNKYEFMARLFAQIKSYSLAAFFYQISYGEVPVDIYAKAEFMIIPLKKSSRASGLMALTISNLREDIQLLLDNLIRH